jgi:hypothetical protein
MNDPRRSIYVLRLRGKGCDDIRELRRTLKILLRRFGLRCLSITEEQAPQRASGDEP